MTTASAAGAAQSAAQSADEARSRLISATIFKPLPWDEALDWKGRTIYWYGDALSDLERWGLLTHEQNLAFDTVVFDMITKYHEWYEALPEDSDDTSGYYQPLFSQIDDYLRENLPTAAWDRIVEDLEVEGEE